MQNNLWGTESYYLEIKWGKASPCKTRCTLFWNPPTTATMESTLVLGFLSRENPTESVTWRTYEPHVACLHNAYYSLRTHIYTNYDALSEKSGEDISRDNLWTSRYNLWTSRPLPSINPHTKWMSFSSLYIKCYMLFSRWLLLEDISPPMLFWTASSKTRMMTFPVTGFYATLNLFDASYRLLKFVSIFMGRLIYSPFFHVIHYFQTLFFLLIIIFPL